ncbi:hypothetical protein [Marinomonas pollencensis]|uniref:Uncharacterized protein n=1 Tax=Marinomonas pollencensis TaxID=491954 RepID=A0A3E0DTP7_9GAMM|nr:hypothetical protein [Marinomonas pollencensis]REG85843.1 hypothetical protein DFP81_102382 [Marinomonas pollencensis]
MCRLTRLVACLLTLLFLVSCSSHSTQREAQPGLFLSSNNLPVFMSSPQVSFVLITKIQVPVQEGFDQEARLRNTLAVLTEMAAEVGANAIIVTNAEEFAAAYNRVSTGTHFLAGASFDLSPDAFKHVQLKAQAIYLNR